MCMICFQRCVSVHQLFIRLKCLERDLMMSHLFTMGLWHFCAFDASLMLRVIGVHAIFTYFSPFFLC